MFENAGSKIKGLAIFNFIVWLIAGIGVGIYSKNTEVFIVSILLGGFVGWLSSILLYAFGELCENVYKIANMASDKGKYVAAEPTATQPLVTNASSTSVAVSPNVFGGKPSWRCPKCSTMNLGREDICSNCSYVRNN